jgi:hypothetical protein
MSRYTFAGGKTIPPEKFENEPTPRDKPVPLSKTAQAIADAKTAALKKNLATKQRTQAGNKSQ